METKKYMSIDHLVDYIPFQRSTIYSKVHKKEIPYLKVGKKLVFEKEKIDEWIRGNYKTTKQIVIPNFIK